MMFCEIKNAEICFDGEGIAKETLKDLKELREKTSRASTDELLDAIIDAIKKKVDGDESICVKIGEC